MSSGYRLAPALAARLVGAALIAAAVLVAGATLVVAAFDFSVLVLIALGVVALMAIVGLVVATRTVPVLRVDEAGYRVRWVRGAGVKAATWGDVEDAVAASPEGIDCVVLRLRDGRTTSLPVAALAAEREEFVARIRDHLRRGEGLRPL